MGKKIISSASVCIGFFGLGYLGGTYINDYFREPKQKDSLEFIEKRDYNKLIGEIKLKTDSVPFTSAGYFTAIDNEGRRYKIDYDIVNREVSISEVKLENKIAKSD